MEYILIPTESKTETAFFLSLLKKMQKTASTISTEEMEEIVFAKALKQAEKTEKGSLSKVKTHLAKVASVK
jgi:di/tripeptidase